MTTTDSCDRCKKTITNLPYKMVLVFFCLIFLVGTVLMSGVTQAYRFVTIDDMGNVKKFSTLKSETNEMLKSQGVATIPQDDITQIDDGHNLNIVINRAVQGSITADAKKIDFLTSPHSTVAEVLKEKEIALSSDDMINCPQTQVVTRNMEIVIKRISKNARTTVEIAPYDQIQKESNSIYEGETKVETKGQDGELTRYFEDTLTDGEVTSSVETGCKVTVDPVDEVVLVGTKKRVAQVAQSSSSSSKAPTVTSTNTNGKRVIKGTATAYSGGGTTATGTSAGVGKVAVNPNVIPYGTRLYIETPDGKYVYGEAVAADTGGAAMRGDIVVDLYMSSESECRAFGRRTVNVYIL